MIHEIENADTYKGRDQTGSIVGRYASIIDDRIENTGNSRSVISLKLYTSKQLQDELDERDSDET